MRIGLAGGGSDLASFSNNYGGQVFNTTINLHAYTTIKISPSKRFRIFHKSIDLGIMEEYKPDNPNPRLKLLQGVTNFFFQQIPKVGQIDISTYSEVPSGSGLGTSSTIVVSIISCYSSFLNINLSRYQIAEFSVYVERELLKFAGGMQDQYAATFGGFNHIEFKTNKTVIVNNVRPSESMFQWLESSCILYYTGSSRESSKIIQDQEERIQHAKNSISKEDYINNIIRLGDASNQLKEAFIREKKSDFIQIMNQCWEIKKNLSNKISNPKFDLLINALKDRGAQTVKISGAGGGGFAVIISKLEERNQLIKYLETKNGRVYNFSFTNKGVTTWKE